MSLVRSRFHRPSTVPAPFGSGFDPVYEEKLVDGVSTLVKVNENPLNDFVQASLQETLIYNILQKYQNGNVDVLNRMNGQYFDATVFPTSLADAQNQILRAEGFFSTLPLEVRKQFDNSSSVFLSKIADVSAFDILSPKSDVESEADSVES